MPIAREAEPARKRDHAVGQQRPWAPVECGGHGQNRPPTARADAVAAIRTERAAARVQSGDRSGVAHDLAATIQREHAILAAVEVDERPRRVERKASRVGYARIVAERSGRLTVGVEAQECVVAAAVGDAGARDQQRSHRRPRKSPRRARVAIIGTAQG